MRAMILAVILVGISTGLVLAERPPQKRDDAEVVVTGSVEKIQKSDMPFGGDGINTTYTATVKVSKVSKGDVKVGDTIQVTWFRVTKNPSNPLPGAYGQAHKIAEKDVATFWLLGGKSPYTVIYNLEGIEKVKK
ncbi:MAG: hypothetical protein SNJ75_03450 [Gemmataceae bacterium]